jgi:hypothetical protein
LIAKLQKETDNKEETNLWNNGKRKFYVKKQTR